MACSGSESQYKFVEESLMTGKMLTNCCEDMKKVTLISNI